KATVDRLLTFRTAMDAAQLAPGAGIELVVDGAADVRAEHVDLALPDGRIILANTSVVIAPGDRLLISGPSGVGKSTLFRALARAVLHRPEWLFVDEATAALDEGSEARLYTLLNERLPNTAIVSVAHRPQVAGFHTTNLDLRPDGQVGEPRPSVQAGR